MKIRLESGECLVVEVPVRLATGAIVSIRAEPLPSGFAAQLVTHFSQLLVDVVIEDGLIGSVTEHVVRRHAEGPGEDRVKLWAHIVSQHASMLSPETPLDVLIDVHEHEHDGPGTIRNHPRESREYSLKKLGEVLSESDQ